MNILMLGWELPPHNSGGLGVACYHMAKALSLQGANIDFVVPYKAKHPGIGFMEIHSATELDPLHRYGMGAYDSSNAGKINGKATDIRQVQKEYLSYVEQLVEEIDTPDVIHAHDWLTMDAGVRAKELTNSELIVHVHATEFDRSGNNTGNPMVHEIEYHGLMMADKIFAVSQVTKDIIVEKYKIPADKIEVVHNGIDVDDFNDGYEYDINTYKYLEDLKKEGYTVVSTITRFTIQKGLEYFVRAAALACSKYPRIVFLLAGDGEQRDELISLASELGISDKIFFTGFVRGKKWRDAYSVSDAFVMSSVSEPFGLTALEAAHHGNVLIITRQSGVGEVLKNIFRYDFWDVNRLGDQIVAIASSPALKETLRDNVSKEYYLLSWTDVASKIMGHYSHAASRRIYG
jgi:glycosyltransferase involved in cell wall biosynthesis